MARFGTQWLSSGTAAFNLRQCASVVNQIIVGMIERPRDLASLASVVQKVEEEQAVVSYPLDPKRWVNPQAIGHERA
jgi:hypothetical protein